MDLPKEGAAGAQYDLVRLDLLVLAGQRHVEKVLVLAQLAQRRAHVPLEIVPAKAKLLRPAHFACVSVPMYSLLTYLISYSLAREHPVPGPCYRPRGNLHCCLALGRSLQGQNR
jgi:hypothetical protein